MNYCKFFCCNYVKKPGSAFKLLKVLLRNLCGILGPHGDHVWLVPVWFCEERFYRYFINIEKRLIQTRNP